MGQGRRTRGEGNGVFFQISVKRGESVGDLLRE